MLNQITLLALVVVALALAAGARQHVDPPRHPAKRPALEKPPAHRQATPLQYGVNLDVDKKGGLATGAELEKLGVTLARFSIKLAGFTGRGPIADHKQLAHYKAILQDLQRHHVQALIVVGGAAIVDYPVMSKDKAAWDAYRARYAEGLATIVQELSPLVENYEIWNEPDEPNPRPHYQPNVPAERFGELLRDAYKAVKAHSRALVISGGADSGHEQYLVAAARATGGHLWADGVGIHPYGALPEPDFQYPGKTFGNLADAIAKYYKALRIPIWITEFGTTVQPIQAAYTSRMLGRMAATPGHMLERGVIFCWSDAMVAGFGIVDEHGKPKESHAAMRDFLASARPHKKIGHK
jgi:hypothetical protein